MKPEEEFVEAVNPDATLKAIRKEAERVILALNTKPTDMSALAELLSASESMTLNFQALDSWLSQQGYLPKDWFFPAGENREEY